MRLFTAATLVLLISNAAAGAQLDSGLRRLADHSPSPTGGAALGTFPALPACGPEVIDTRCAERAALAAHVRREADIARVSAAWPMEAKRALATLRLAQHGFAAAVAANEVDHRGTDADDQAQAAAEGQAESFASLLRRLTDDSGRSIALDMAPAEAEARLQASYAIVMAEPLADGALTRNGVRETQDTWTAYRDAFVGLMRVLERPTASAEAELAAARTRDLEGLIAD